MGVVAAGVAAPVGSGLGVGVGVGSPAFGVDVGSGRGVGVEAVRAAVTCGRGRAVGVTATRKVAAVGSRLTMGDAAVDVAARSTDDATVTGADIAVGCGSAAGEGLGSHPANATATNVTQVATSADDFSLALIFPVSR